MAFYTEAAWKIGLWVYFFNVFLPKWFNLDLDAAYPKFGIFRAFHIFIQKKFWKTSPPLKVVGKLRALMNFEFSIASTLENL